MRTETTSREVSQYDWSLYQQAIEKAKRLFRQNHDQAAFDAACKAAHNRLMTSE